MKQTPRPPNRLSERQFAMLRLGDWFRKKSGKPNASKHADPDAFPAFLRFNGELWDAIKARFGGDPGAALEVFRATRQPFSSFQWWHGYERLKAREAGRDEEE